MGILRKMTPLGILKFWLHFFEKVTINGIDFSGMDKKEAVAAFEEKEMSFDEEKKEKFFNGESASLYVDSKDYFYILKEENGELYTIEVEKNIY